MGQSDKNQFKAGNSNVKFTWASFFRQFICLHALVDYDAFWKHALSWPPGTSIYLILAPYCQVNMVKNDILKLFDSIEKYGMSIFAFTLFKFQSDL